MDNIFIIDNQVYYEIYLSIQLRHSPRYITRHSSKITGEKGEDELISGSSTKWHSPRTNKVRQRPKGAKGS